MDNTKTIATVTVKGLNDDLDTISNEENKNDIDVDSTNDKENQSSSVGNPVPSNLVQYINGIFRDNGAECPDIWYKDFCKNIEIEAIMTKSPKEQRFFINRVLGYLIGTNYNPDTNSDEEYSENLQARFYLVNDGEIEDWLDFVKNSVVPYIINNIIKQK